MENFSLFTSIVRLKKENKPKKNKKTKPGGLDLSRRDLDRDLDLDTEKKFFFFGLFSFFNLTIEVNKEKFSIVFEV